MRGLVGEIQALIPEATFGYVNPDGFGVWRRLTVDPETSHALRSALITVCQSDRRIITFGSSLDGGFWCDFVGHMLADHKDPWMLESVHGILTSPEVPPGEPSE